MYRNTYRKLFLLFLSFPSDNLPYAGRFHICNGNSAKLHGRNGITDIPERFLNPESDCLLMIHREPRNLQLNWALPSSALNTRLGCNVVSHRSACAVRMHSCSDARLPSCLAWLFSADHLWPDRNRHWKLTRFFEDRDSVFCVQKDKNCSRSPEKKSARQQQQILNIRGRSCSTLRTSNRLNLYCISFFPCRTREKSFHVRFPSAVAGCRIVYCYYVFIFVASMQVGPP